MAKKIVPAQSSNNQEKAAAFLNVKIMCADGKARTIGKFGLGLFASSKLDAFLIQELSSDPDKIESLQEKLVISFHEVADEATDIAELVQL